MIAALIPRAGAGHTLPVLPFLESAADTAFQASLIVANLNAAPFDFVARQKVPATHFTWYVLEQMPGRAARPLPNRPLRPPRPPPRSSARPSWNSPTPPTTWAPFARALGHVDESGNVKPPFVWNEDRRLHLRAKLDAVFFHLYGLTDRNDVRYIYSTFPIVERRETATYGRYRSRDVCLAWLNALAAGEPDANILL